MFYQQSWQSRTGSVPLPDRISLSRTAVLRTKNHSPKMDRSCRTMTEVKKYGRVQASAARIANGGKSAIRCRSIRFTNQTLGQQRRWYMARNDVVLSIALHCSAEEKRPRPKPGPGRGLQVFRHCHDGGTTQ